MRHGNISTVGLRCSLSFVDNLIKCSIGWWADTLAALLPSRDTGISYLIVNPVYSISIFDHVNNQSAQQRSRAKLFILSVCGCVLLQMPHF